MLQVSATNCDTLVSWRSLSGPTVVQPIFSSRSAIVVSRSVLPTRSPKPLTVPCTWVAPARTAASVFATAQPESLWQWMPMRCPGSSAATAATISPTSCGSAPPFVSQRSIEWAPASLAARTQASA